MMPNNMKRLQKEKEYWDNTPPTNMRGRPLNGSLTEWQFVFKGPLGSPYAHIFFDVRASVPPEYPAKPPTMRFETIIFHPNVNATNGNICIDVLQGQWAPGNTLAMMVNSVVALMVDPFPDSPLNSTARDLYRADINAYKRRAREQAMAKGSFEPPNWYQ